MVYVDTSALVALIVNEPGSAGVAKWYAGTKAVLVSSVWCMPEFASALGIKQRTRQLDSDQAVQAWDWFGRLVANDIRLLQVEPSAFQRAAALVLASTTGLRAGDALHLACAEAAGATGIATLDTVLATNAKALKLKPVSMA